MANDTSQVISPPILGQTSVQIGISYIQKGREGQLMWDSYLAFSSSPVEVIWHCYTVVFWWHTIGMTRNPRIPSTAHTTPLTSHLPQTLRITMIIIPNLQWRHMASGSKGWRDLGMILDHGSITRIMSKGMIPDSVLFLLPWAELQRAIEASLPNPSF